MVRLMTNEHSSTSCPTTSCPPPADLAVVAMDHIRLSYCYLDEGDIDGYCSLFTEQAVIRQPGTPTVSGRLELERIERARRGTSRSRHFIHELIASGRRVAAIGRLRTAAAELHFVDVFTIADNGL